MNVSTILKDKGKTVVTTTKSATVLDVVKSLAAKRIGAIVVLGDNKRVEGIISERDIIRVLAASGPQILTANVTEVMTQSVITCSSIDTLDALMQKMTTGRFRHLPVVDNGKLVGIVSIGDVVKIHVAEVELEANAMRDYIST